MTAKIILNPYSARWNALKRRPEAEAALQAAGVAYELAVSEYPGHGIELARQAVLAGFGPVIAAGGDSTYNEVINGIVQAHAGQAVHTHFGILPMGTANDLAANTGIPLDLAQAAQIIAAGHTRRMDVCQVNERYFVNNSAIGLETTVTVIQSEEMKRVKGIVRYLLATLVAIWRNPQWKMDIVWDEGEYHGPATLVSVGNGPRTGGIFYTVPHADPFDGKISFIYGVVPTRLGILRALPKIMRPAEGNISEHPAVHEFHTGHLRIHCQPSTPAHTDGEVFDKAIHDLEYRILPGCIPMLLHA